MQARRLSWEQMIHERSHSGVPSAAPAAIPAAVPGFQVKQQHAMGMDDTSSVADIGGSPFAHLSNGAAAVGGSSRATALMSIGGSGPLSPVRSAAGTAVAAAAAGHLLASPVTTSGTPAAVPATRTLARAGPGSGDAVSMSASPFAAMFAGLTADESTQVGMQGSHGTSSTGSVAPTPADPFAAGLPVDVQSRGAAAGSAAPVSVSPFASELPAFGDPSRSLTSAVMAASADAAAAAPAAPAPAAAGGAKTGGVAASARAEGWSEGWSGVSRGPTAGSSTSGGKPGEAGDPAAAAATAATLYAKPSQTRG
jgi:hypothetical protein